MPAKLVRCWRKVRIGERDVWRGCGLVWDGERWGEWRTDAEDGALCPTCGHILEQEQRKARVRIERRTERRAAKGFGPAPEGVDPFRGMR
jgi:hypothetical protein